MISVVALAVFSIGVAFDVFDRVYDWLERSSPIAADDVLAVFAILAAAFAVFAVRTLQRAEREGALREETEQRYRAMVEQVPSVSYTWDPSAPAGDVATLYVSPQIERLLGYSQKEWVSTPTFWIERIHSDDRAGVVAASERSDRSGAPFRQDYRMIAKDGRIVWIRDESTLVSTDPEGETPRARGVMYDITEQKEAEEQIQEAENRYRTMVERVPAVAYTWDSADGVGEAPLLYISPQIERLLGLTADQWMSDPSLWSRHVHPDDRTSTLEAWADAAARGETFMGEYRLRSADGRWLWVRDEAVPVSMGLRGRPIYQGVMLDITQQKYAEERYRQLVSELPVVTYLADGLDPNGDHPTPYVSPGIEQLTGRPAAEWMTRAQTWAEMIHPDDRDRVLEEGRKTDRSGERFEIEYRFLRDDGEVVWVRDSAVLVQRDGAWPVWQGVIEDITARRETESRLREAEERYRTLVEQIPAITYIDECHDVGDARIWPNVYISPQVETILGYSPEEWRDDPELRASLIHPDDLAGSLEADRRHYESGEPLAREIRLMGKDGSFHWLRDEAIIVRDDAGRPLWSQGILLDITERKSAEGHLHEAEARYRGLIETIPAATYIDTVEAVSQGIYMSPQVEAIFGYTPEEWLRRPELWEQGVHPDDLPGVAVGIERLNRDGTPFDAEYRFRRPDGRTVWVHDQAVVIRDEQGEPRLCQGVMFDITERREAQEQLREAEERFRAIVEHVPAGIYLDLPDTSMQTMYASPQLQDITGISAEEWTSNPDAWVEVMHEEDREEVLGRYLAAIAAQEPWSAEYRMQRHDGRIIWVHDETTLIRNEDGRDAMLLGVISDITDRKLAEQALRESEQREREAAERLRVLDEMKNTFLAAVSHELRSPLTAILGLALTLERSEMVENDRNDLLERLAANARKLDRLLKDLLDIDRLNRGIVEPQYRVTDVGALARRTVESLDALADRSIMAFADPVVLSVDPAKVERIVENLLMNAARHTAADSTIWLRVRSHEGGVLIAVEDDGAGVPEELREAIFEPFRQGPTSSSHSPGTGIGLSLVGRFSELHGGRAWVEEREGGGASFRVFLPAGPMKGSESLALGAEVALDGSAIADGHAEAG